MAKRPMRSALAPAAATLVTFVAMGAMMVPRWMHPVPKLPVLTVALAKGQRVEPSDVKWQPANQVSVGLTLGRPEWAADALNRGDILSPGLVVPTLRPNRMLLIEITPSNASDLSVEKWVNTVEVIIVKSNRIIWNSGPRPIVSNASSLLGGASSNLGVWLPLKSAMAYERDMGQGAVRVIGVSS